MCVVREATHHPRRLLHVTVNNSVSYNQGAQRASLTRSACLTVLRAPLGGDGACFAAFFDVCLTVFCALLAAVLALPAALLAAPFITVREPFLACRHAMAHRRYSKLPATRCCMCASRLYATETTTADPLDGLRSHLQLEAGLPECAAEKAFLE